MLKEQTYKVRLVRELLDKTTGAVTKEEKFVTVAAEGGSLAFVRAKNESGRAEGWTPVSFKIVNPAPGEKRPDQPA